MKHIYIDNCIPNGGILHYIFENGKLCLADRLPLDKPMYTVFENDCFYTLLRETDKKTHFGSVISGKISNNGTLTLKSGASSVNGICPCHLCINNGNIFVTNYLSGSITKIGGRTVTHTGHGVNPKRQEAAHTHSIIPSPDGRYLLSADLGLDKVFIYDNDLNEISVACVPRGNGCRHLIFSPNGKYLFCVNELSSDVSVFAYNSGSLNYLKTYSCNLPSAIENTASAIRYNNGRLYVSHRGADCITCFNEYNGELSFVSNTYCGGKSPRDFQIVGDSIIVANEGGSIGILSLVNGNPEFVESVECIGNPLCVNYIDL